MEVDIGVKAKVLLAGANSTAKATAPLNLMLVFLEIETVTAALSVGICP